VLTLILLLGVAQTVGDADRLYADRTNLESAHHAATIWEERLTRDRNDFEAAWKLSRICYWLGGHAERDDQRRQYERGVEAGRRASMLEPKQPDGYFWMAANMGMLAESFGLRQGLKYRGPIKEALETVRKSTRVISRDPRIGRSVAGTSRCRGCSAEATKNRLNTCSGRSCTTRTVPSRTIFLPRRFLT